MVCFYSLLLLFCLTTAIWICESYLFRVNSKHQKKVSESTVITLKNYDRLLDFITQPGIFILVR